jgi:hypothetical protein
MGHMQDGQQNESGEHSDVDIMVLVDLDDEEIKEIEQEVFDYTFDMDLKYNVLFSPIIESVENYNSRLKFIPFYKNVSIEGVLING